jgi:hypothetical protein
MAKLFSDEELLVKLLFEHTEALSEKECSVFKSMHAQLERRTLSNRQRYWIQYVADRLGLQTAPSRNAFSELSKAQQREHQERAANVKLPWEQPGYTKALKPPGSK